MLIHPETLKLTASAGAISGNTQRLRGICYEILVNPATETTVYDITITDADDIVVFETTTTTGTLAETVVLPVREIYTVSIANATVDELFLIKLMVRER